jgi:putative oxidoreductase
MSTQTTTDYAAAALRVSTGILFLAHGWMKISVFTVPGTVAFCESLGLPGILAYLTIVSLALIPVLLGAVWAHSGNGWSFSAEGGGWEYPLFWAVLQAAVTALGSGAFALRIPTLQRSLGQFA